MTALPSYQNITQFCPSGTKIAPTNYTNGFIPQDLFPAEWANYLFNAWSTNLNLASDATTGVLVPIQTEMINTIQDSGFSLVTADNYQLEKAIIAMSNPIGAIIYSEIELTPVTLAGARTTTNPSNPIYNPIIKRYDSDHDITTAQAPDLVTAYRAEVAKINVVGSIVSSWTGTVSGSTITFASNATNLALVTMYANEALANGYIQTQTAGASALYTGTAQRCINVAGTDYAVTGTNVGAYTITVSGTPTTGSQTCIAYTYRIAGSSTSVRLPRISGFVGVVAQDYDGVINSGWRKMDQMQGHFHNIKNSTSGTASSFAMVFSTTASPNAVTGGASGQNASLSVDAPITDGTNGTTRTGKTTDPRTYGMYAYTHAGRLLT